jgi:hypothetical protein
MTEVSVNWSRMIHLAPLWAKELLRYQLQLLVPTKKRGGGRRKGITQESEFLKAHQVA